MSQPTAVAKPFVPKKHFWKPCALIINKRLFGGKGLGLQVPITTTIQVHRETDSTSWTGFSIEIPFGPQIEEEGFGMCHGVNHTNGRGSVVPIQTYKIEVKFPYETDSSVEEASPRLLKLLPDTGKKMCRLSVSLKPGDHCHVKGYGGPFSNPGDLCEKVIKNESLIFFGDMALVDIIQQRQFSFVVSTPSGIMATNWSYPLPLPFQYPYSEEHF